MIVVPQWPYLVEIGGSISLQPPQGPGGEATLGDWFGEWGSFLDEHGRPARVRLMFVPDGFSLDSGFARARNVRCEDGELVVLFEDHRLPTLDGMPFLPVYRAVRADGREILQLSGYGPA